MWYDPERLEEERQDFINHPNKSSVFFEDTLSMGDACWEQAVALNCTRAKHPESGECGVRPFRISTPRAMQTPLSTTAYVASHDTANSYPHGRMCADINKGLTCNIWETGTAPKGVSVPNNIRLALGCENRPPGPAGKHKRKCRNTRQCLPPQNFELPADCLDRKFCKTICHCARWYYTFNIHYKCMFMFSAFKSSFKKT